MKKEKNVEQHQVILILKKDVECFSYNKNSKKEVFQTIRKWNKSISDIEVMNFLKEIRVKKLSIICEENELIELPFVKEPPNREEISFFLQEKYDYFGESFQNITHSLKQKVTLIALNKNIEISFWKKACDENEIELSFFEFESIIISKLVFDKFPSGASILRIEEHRAIAHSFAKGMMNRKDSTLFQDKFDINRLNQLFSKHRMIHQKNYPLLFDMGVEDDDLLVLINKFWSGPVHDFSCFSKSKINNNYYKSLIEGMEKLPEYDYTSSFPLISIGKFLMVFIFFICFLFLSLEKKDSKLGYFEPSEFQSRKTQDRIQSEITKEIDDSLNELKNVILQLKKKSNTKTVSDSFSAIKMSEIDLKNLRYVGAFKNKDKKRCGLFTYMNGDMTFCEQQNVAGINFSFLGKTNALVIFQKHQFRIDKSSITLYE
ncbi:MAG: hypothetical protein COB02_04510 [Candidatus Cloacimonadota bacterium]|nr:MAG: hypothetical protein COB02_04510 [Candidatus Cloacimonadota bacterium]